jgi:hypothetical protein
MVEPSLISSDLKTALDETIRMHADRYERGKVDLAKVLAALGEIGSDFLAEIPELDQRRALYWTIVSGLLTALRWKAENLPERATRQ